MITLDKNLNTLFSNVSNYGIDVAMSRDSYSSINDKTFHKLRINYINAQNELHKYIVKMKKASK